MRPAWNARAPSMSPTTCSPDGSGPTFGDSVRSIVRLNVSALTCSDDGGEKRIPGRIRKVYVRPIG